MACSSAMSQTVEIVSNLRPIIFGLKVRTRGPQPSICVRTFSLFTKKRGKVGENCTSSFGNALSPMYRLVYQSTRQKDIDRCSARPPAVHGVSMAFSLSFHHVSSCLLLKKRATRFLMKPVNVTRTCPCTPRNACLKSSSSPETSLPCN